MSNPDNAPSFAADVLHGSTTALAQLLEQIRPCLCSIAKRWLGDTPTLRAHGDADDLVQAFLAENVLPSHRLSVLLGPVAAGQRPLLPRLRASFGNFLRSRLRRRALTIDAQVGGGAEEYDPPAPASDAWPDIFARVAAQSNALRQAFPAPESGIPWGAVLRLSEHVRLAQIVAACLAPDDGRTIGRGTSVSDAVVEMAPWTATEAEQTLPPNGTTLAATWEAIRERTSDQPQRAAPRTIAAIVGTTRSGWDQWLCRARQRLSVHMGSTAAHELFPLWPASVFERAATFGRSKP